MRGTAPLGSPETPTGAAAAPAQATSRGLRWGLLVGAAAVAAIGLVLMFLLTQATNNQALYERNYPRLFAINVAVAALLLATIVWIAWRLIARLRRGRFGSRLLVKLAATFALVGLLPGVLVYVVSYQFVSRSIESWFDVKVEGALDAGLNLGRVTLDTLAADLANKTRAAGGQLVGVPDATAGIALARLRDQLVASDVSLWTASGQLIAGTGESRFQLNPERPTAQQLRQARGQRAITQIEGLDDIASPTPSAAVAQPRIKALVLVPASSADLLNESRFLQVTQRLPANLIANAAAVTEANREYQERALGREGLRRMYIGTLTLSLFLSVFGTVLLAVLLGNQLARPLLVLADGVREVAAGDLRPKAVLQSRDELGGLTRAFADMTQQLADARADVDASMVQVSAARANLQTILDNLTAGVMVLDDQGVVHSANPGATRILRAPMAAHLNQPLSSIPGLEEFGQAVLNQFQTLQAERQLHGLDHWQQSFELNAAKSGVPADTISLIARGAEMPGGAWLLVFDDISEVVSAQRAQAWGEVARRLAHEIKNPLTPIQLSAERLAMKLDGKLATPEQTVLTKSVKTIVDQVDSMKRLVDEFRDYARLPAAELKPLQLNQVIADVLQLYPSNTTLAPVSADLDPDCPPVLGDVHQLRQVLHNLLQNAQDAAEGRTDAAVSVRTRWVPGSRRVRLSVRDNGPGFPEHILKRAFEPYVTTKAKGTGLGLAVVKKIADEHSARIDLNNRGELGAVQGAEVSLSFTVVN